MTPLPPSHAAGDGDASRATRSSTARRTRRVRAVTVRTATPVTASAAEARRVTATSDCGLSARASQRRTASEPSMTSAASTARLTDNGAVAHRRSTAADATTAATNRERRGDGNGSVHAQEPVGQRWHVFARTWARQIRKRVVPDEVDRAGGNHQQPHAQRRTCRAGSPRSIGGRRAPRRRSPAAPRRAPRPVPPAGSHDHPAHTGSNRATTAIDSPSDAPTCTSRERHAAAVATARAANAATIAMAGSCRSMDANRSWARTPSTVVMATTIATASAASAACRLPRPQSDRATAWPATGSLCARARGCRIRVSRIPPPR